MKIGVAHFTTVESIHPIELAQELEQRGFASLLFTEHTHIPVSRRTPWPGGGELPDYYKRTLDPFATLGALAASTSRIQLGTAVCLVTQHDPIVLAKQVSTIDQLSQGRVLFGVGAGWNEDELENHGADPRRRWTLLRERVEAMRAVWAGDVAECHGELVDFDPIWQWPKPVQQPGPPVILGASTVKAIPRAARYCDGWMPIASTLASAGVDILDAMDDLARACAEQGRPAPYRMTYGAPADLAELERLAEGGIEHALIVVPTEPRDDALRFVEGLQPLVERFAR